MWEVRKQRRLLIPTHLQELDHSGGLVEHLLQLMEDDVMAVAAARVGPHRAQGEVASMAARGPLDGHLDQDETEAKNQTRSSGPEFIQLYDSTGPSAPATAGSSQPHQGLHQRLSHRAFHMPPFQYKAFSQNINSRLDMGHSGTVSGKGRFSHAHRAALGGSITQHQLAVVIQPDLREEAQVRWHVCGR